MLYCWWGFVVVDVISACPALLWVKLELAARLQLGAVWLSLGWVESLWCSGVEPPVKRSQAVSGSSGKSPTVGWAPSLQCCSQQAGRDPVNCRYCLQVKFQFEDSGFGWLLVNLVECWINSPDYTQILFGVGVNFKMKYYVWKHKT